MGGICTDIVVSYVDTNLFVYVAYSWHLRGIFVAGTYMAIICEVYIAFGYIFTHECNHVGSICLSSIMAM